MTRVIGKPVVLQVTVDEAILGSLVVRVGDDLTDGSVRSRLERGPRGLRVASQGLRRRERRATR